MSESSIISDELKPKTQVTGKVIKTALGGALIELSDGQKGLLHISQMADGDGKPVNRVEDFLKVDQSVDLWVKRIKPEHIELTMLKPLALDWRDIKSGMVVKGKIAKLDKFGAFVDIGAARQGLIHISEMAHGYVKSAGDVVKEGYELDVMVLDVDRRKRQIKLSIKALTPEPEKEEAPARPERSTNKGRGPRKPKQEQFQMETEPVIPEPTAMEILLKEAMEKADAKQKFEKREKARAIKRLDDDQEEILARTLENKVQTT
ncbi:MAG: S1 RNA-binding domain-containing protein [Anaerolineaceae bacterium]|nr:S1 RNA-binding domain-containing protein [Anaerolineaceae bacterium]